MLPLNLTVLLTILPLINDTISAFSFSANTFSTRYPIRGAICIHRGNDHHHSARNRTVQRFLLGNNLEATLHKRYSSQLYFSSNSSANEVEQYNGVGTLEELDKLQATIEKLRIDAAIASQRASMAEETVEIFQLKIREAEADLREKDKFLEEEKNKLLERIDNVTSLFTENEAEIKSATDALVQEVKTREQKLMEEIAQWRDSLIREQQKLEEQRNGASELKERLLKAEDQLEFEQMRFLKETIDLTKRITEDMAKLTKLENEKATLEKKSEDQQSRIDEVEDYLDSQKKVFEDEKRRLEGKVDESAILLNLKRRQMFKRYQKIRKEMGGLLEMVRNDARNEQTRLKKAIYEKSNLIDSLQYQLDSANLAFQQYNQLREELVRQKEEFAEERSKIETQFSENLQEQNEVIEELNRIIGEKDEDLRLINFKIKEMSDETNLVRKEMSSLLEKAKNDATAKIADLNSSIVVLETDLREREKKILSYESSYREMVRLSIKLTGRRIRRAGSKVGSLFRKRTKKV